jgi:hypothetical protein
VYMSHPDIPLTLTEPVPASAKQFNEVYAPRGWVAADPPASSSTSDAWLPLTKAEGEALWLSQSEADDRYSLLGTGPPTGAYLTQADADARYMQLVAGGSAFATRHLRVINADEAPFSLNGNDSFDNTQKFIDLTDAASAAGGALINLRPGIYRHNGDLPLNQYTHWVGSEPAPRYYGRASTPPPSVCAIRLKTGATGSASVLAKTNFAAGSMRDLHIMGANVGSTGSPIDGLRFPGTASLEHQFVTQNVTIWGHTGHGMRGRLWAQRHYGLMIGGNWKRGLAVSGSEAWTDVWFIAPILNGNTEGNVLVDTTGEVGEVHFISPRVERAGWNPATPTTPFAASPGWEIRGNCHDFEVIAGATDANAGHGLYIQKTSGRFLHHLRFACRFKRDGCGTNLAAGAAPDFSAVHVQGLPSGNTSDYVDLSGSYTMTGWAIDGGAVGYLHPKYGLTSPDTSYLVWVGGALDPAHPGGAINPTSVTATWRPQLHLGGVAPRLTLPVYANATALPTPAFIGEVAFQDDTNAIRAATSAASGTGGVSTWAP